MSFSEPLTAEIVLQAYAAGIFPMAETREDDQIFWVDPKRRGVLPLDRFHISRSLARRLRKAPFEISVDRDFAGVLEGCADRPETWINGWITEIYLDLFNQGFAHSLEVWEGTRLVGGVYGVTLGGAFFGESMFSRRTDASKIALAYLVDRLRAGGFRLFDTQFLTTHLASLGAEEISRAEYHRRLRRAVAVDAAFEFQAETPSPQEVIQRSTQTS